MKYYAGIGSRSCPTHICVLMTEIACVLNDKGYTLRSGGADGSDKAFEAGAGNNKEILRPHHATNEAIDLAMSLHPAPHACNTYVRKLHGRNAQIILGRQLDAPVEFVILWTPGGKTIGGTGMGIRIADVNDILVYNLFKESDMLRVKKRFGICK